MKKLICLSFLFVAQAAGTKVERPEAEPSHKLSRIHNIIRTIDDFLGTEWLGYRKIAEENEHFIKNIIHELNMDDYCIEIRGMSKYAQRIFGRLNAFVMPSTFFGRKSHAFFYLGEEAFKELSNHEKEAIVKHELMHIKHNHGFKQFTFTIVSGLTLYVLAYLASAKFSKKSSNSLTDEGNTQNLLHETLAASCVSLALVTWPLLIYKYSRLCEKEADVEAAKTMKNKQGMIDLFNALEEEYGDVESKFLIKRLFNDVMKVLLLPCAYIGSLFATHPTIKERIAYIQDLE